MYKDLESVPNLPAQEKEVLAFWDSENVVEKLKQLRAGEKNWVYYDGPITANNIPHYGHAITWTMKDVVPRYWSMKGYQVDRNMGWDTKGILVEYEVEKELKFTKKSDIKAFGEARFIKYCREYVGKYKKIMFEYEKRLGRWFDESAMYSTDDPKFVESMWWALKKLYGQGLLYEGHKVVAYSTRAGMTLSTHEVSDGGYKDVEDPFVTVKFKLKGRKNEYFLAWTTTPWTIPGNLMLAANEDLDYVKVSVGSDVFIVAKDRVKEVLKEEKHKILETFKGSELEGLEYEQPFKIFEDKRSEGCFRVVLSPHASAEEGTGIVHLAPYGEEDFEIFMKLGIKLFDYLDESANFTDLVPDYGGLFYKDANDKIINDLKEVGVLYDNGTLTHRMPMCYRTGTPLIYKPVKSWYIATTKLKDRMLEENQKLSWYPKHLKDGNSKVWIENARDWALSRSRYWGTPLPLWINDQTGERVLIGSLAELYELSGVRLTDPHRPVVDEVTWEDKKNGGTFRRVLDVIDVWFDSGSMPFAQFHYPFENEEKFNKYMPAQYISEGPDQVRLWFYTMHVLGVALFDKVPYQNVLTIGNLLDESGKKMSKSKRNYRPMEEVLDEFGADVLRYFILTSSIVTGVDSIFASDALQNARKEFFIPLWNSLKFFTTYANFNGFEGKAFHVEPKNILDRWVLLRLQETVNGLNTNMESYNVMDASRLFASFVSDLSTWYIRRSRDRLRLGDTDAFATFYTVLGELSILLAPFTPFLAETIYETLALEKITKLRSVHYNLYPEVKKLTASDIKLLAEMKLILQVAEKGNFLRKEAGIKIRQPLKLLTVEANMKPGQDLLELLKDELNVKEVKVKVGKSKEPVVTLDTQIDHALMLEGLARGLIRSIQALRKEMGTRLDSVVEVEYISSSELDEAVKTYTEEIKSKAKVSTLKPGKELKII